MSKETAPVSSSAPTLAPELVSVSNDTVTKESVMGILESMGVMDYDPAVLVALEEYGRRIATDLLCDVKDFATHASRKEIDVEDVRLAIKLKNKKKKFASPHIKAQQDALINQQDLPPFPENGMFLNPKNYPTLQTRPYTYIPGHVAYENQSDSSAASEPSPTAPKSSSQSSSSKSGQAKGKQIPIIMHPENRGESLEKKRVFV